MSIESSFAPSLLSEERQKSFQQAYAASQPYRHAVINELLSDELLRKAREEIVNGLSFTEKETDIYKVNQTGDLANLDGLPEEEKSALSSLQQVRNALYSQEFRSWLELVTGCGPLSAKKKDMSINDYTSGCHLLNHDDVISTRRVSYILYLPDPAEAWDPSWGGALELYPVQDKHIPSNTPSVIIPPKWNQFVFFTVQPGHSFHAVEEVVHQSKSRLSISGWFHRPQSDEPDFDPADDEREEQFRKEHASAENLLSKEFDLPFHPYDESVDPPLPGSELSTADKQFLSFFINPAYLQIRTQSVLFEKFGEDSQILLSEFLKKDVASVLDKGLSAIDQEAGLRWWEHGGRDQVKPTDHQLGVDQAKDWQISGPPHRQRFLTLQQAAEASKPATSNPSLPASVPQDPTELLALLQTKLVPSPAFRHFLANVSQLVPISTRPVQVRRFRPGLDYTLARSDSEAVMDFILDLTPDASASALKAAGATGSAPKGLAAKNKKPPPRKGEGSISKARAKKLKEAWETGEIGGWEAYMPPTEEGDDPAVYGSGAKQDKSSEEANETDMDADGHNGGTAPAAEQDEDEEEEEEDVEMDADDDGPLLTLTPSFNQLSLVLRDERVMRFVKYLSASAGGSRWDIAAEFQAGAAVSDDEDEEA